MNQPARRTILLLTMNENTFDHKKPGTTPASRLRSLIISAGHLTPDVLASPSKPC